MHIGNFQFKNKTSILCKAQYNVCQCVIWAYIVGVVKMLQGPAYQTQEEQ